jgi:hypothetical protein
MISRSKKIFQLLIGLCSLFVCTTICAQEKLYGNEFSSGDVILPEGPFQHARDLNIQTLLKYDVDRLLAGSFGNKEN